MSEWQPIETAPKDRTRIIVWSPHTQKRIFIGHWHQPGNPDKPGFWTGEGVGSRTPTHWMPLPEPPA